MSNSIKLENLKIKLCSESFKIIPNKMKISIVSPSFKRVDYFHHTIDSILSQNSDDIEIEYIVQDGGGSKNIKNLLEEIDLNNRVKSRYYGQVEFHYYIEEDAGMYDAINRGFARASGDIFAWLNTDDMYHPFALSTVAKVFKKFEDVHWIMGIPNSYNMDGARVGFDSFPPAYSREFLRKGLYDVNFLSSGFNWIQQESTFWRRELWEKAGPLNPKMKYAADFHLWKSFAEHTDLVKVYSFLGGFRVHDNQITNTPALYRGELPEVRPPEGLERLHQTLKSNPSIRGDLVGISDAAQTRLLEEYGLRRHELCGRVVRWSHQEQEWKLQWELIL